MKPVSGHDRVDGQLERRDGTTMSPHPQSTKPKLYRRRSVPLSVMLD